MTIDVMIEVEVPIIEAIAQDLVQETDIILIDTIRVTEGDETK